MPYEIFINKKLTDIENILKWMNNNIYFLTNWH